MTTLTLDSAETQCNNLENLRPNLFSTDIFTDKASDPNKKLQRKTPRVRSGILLS